MGPIIGSDLPYLLSSEFVGHQSCVTLRRNFRRVMGTPQHFSNMLPLKAKLVSNKGVGEFHISEVINRSYNVFGKCCLWMIYADRLAATSNGIQDVLLVASEFQMLRIDTPWVVTFVQHEKLIVERSIMQLK